MKAPVTLRLDATRPDQFTRDRALEVNRSIYEWRHLPGLPAFCKGLPEPEVVPRFQAARFDYDLGVSGAQIAISTIAYIRDKARHSKLSHFDDLYTLRRKPDVATRWRTDAEFARQRIAGTNPLLIQRIHAMPANFRVTDEVLAGVLPAPHNMETLLGEGRLFLCDWRELEGAPTALGRFLTAPMALFWSNDKNDLMPLAIQLGQGMTPEESVIFTPADEPWLWLTARTHVQSADAAYHEVVIHLLRTHLMMETVWVSVCRGLPPQHPVHELLAPHFFGTININHKARTEMIVPGGPIDEAISVGSEGAYWLISESLKTLKWEDLDPMQNLDQREVEDSSILPDYHYRDDATRLWDAIGDYTAEVLRIFYPSDDAVAADDELQVWAQELADPDRAGIKGLPGPQGRFEAFEDLHAVVCQVIFTVSCEHSAVNNGQYDIFGYIPNAPGAMFLPAPTDKRRSNEGEFTYALPTMKAATIQLTLVHLLSMPSLSTLGEYPREFFQDEPRVRVAIDRFRSNLDQITIDIHQRNAGLKVPYTYLMPTNVACSINA